MKTLSLYPNRLGRRRFITLSVLSTMGVMTGCAVNPVTGKNQLMLMSEQKEIDVDRMHSPHQLSSDYGVAQDKQLNNYIKSIGAKMVPKTHRPNMPYRFSAVNATYINAYAFPGGTIAITRGILLKLDSEESLSALIGHELGHVNARHTAEIMSKGMLTNILVGGVAIIAGSKDSKYAQMAAQLGMLGSGILLASYSRDNERQADDLGMEYLVKSGYSPKGMIGLMEMLKSLSKHKPSATQMLFSTHPMSDERYNRAVASARGTYGSYMNRPIYRERYMDKTAGLRKIKSAIENMQKGEAMMAKKKYSESEDYFRKALRIAPSDYTGLCLMSKCLMVQEKFDVAKPYAEKAKRVYPMEAQAYHLAGFIKIQRKQFDSAYNDFDIYERKLPGNPNTIFFKGYSLEGMGQKDRSAKEYMRYLKLVKEGENAQHAYRKLVEWGYISR